MTTYFCEEFNTIYMEYMRKIAHIQPLWAMLFDDTTNLKRIDLNQTDDN